MNKEHLISKAEENIKELAKTVFEHTPEHKAVVVYDTSCFLSDILSQAYMRALPEAICIDFNALSAEEILEVLNSLEAMDFVSLVQSTSFRLDAFRIRVELFKRKIKVIEHPHLSRILESDAPNYINALEYDADYFRGTGYALKDKIDKASQCVVDSGGESLTYDTIFESAKLNIGDYSQMTNIGGQFPIGEVFTEAKDLKALNGRLNIFLFGDVTYKINRPETPITLVIKEGQVIDCENSTPDFDEIISNIKRDEGGVVWVRELGFGLNRAFSKTKTVSDTGSYERMCGVHVSLGAKHGMYGKPGFKRRDGMYHVDVFADTNTVRLDNEVIFKDGAWIV